MIGPGFGETLAGARDGDEHAFALLWRDLNPAVLRYLRVVAPGTAEDTAADVWLEVCRGLERFRGHEATPAPIRSTKAGPPSSSPSRLSTAGPAS